MGAAKRKHDRRRRDVSRQIVGRKGGSAKQKSPSIASNSTPSLATARMVYLWSWGPIAGPVNGLQSIKLDGTPIIAADGTQNFPGVKWQFRSGELNQERLTGVSESSNEIQVSQTLTTTNPWVHSIVNTIVDAVRVRLSWPNLQAQDSSGNINGVRIQYALDIATDNGPYIEVLVSEVNRKNITKYERSHRLELPAGSRWTIRARRLTPEANSSLVQDSMVVEAIAEVVDSDQEYPLTAVGCLEYDAQQFGGDIAKVAALMRGRIVRVPANYDPETRTYATGGSGTTNGVWDGSFKEAYSNNPAWVFYDLVLHPYYGLGDRIDASQINRWALYRIAQYCDQLVPDGKGGQEPRFTCNLYLQKQAEAWAVLQDLAAIFHGLAYWDGNQITVNADMPQDSAYTYTLSQILNDGAVKYTGSRLRDRHSLAMVSFDDPDQGYETDKEPVFDEDAIAEYGVRDISVEAVGCTSRGQAQRAGQWALMTEQLQLRGATIRVGLDGYIPKPGKIITLSDPMLSGRANGGRIAGVAGRAVTVDRDINVPAGARLLVNLPSGKTEARQVGSVAGREITVLADYSEIPEPECAWALDYDDLALMQFYVRNVTRPEWHQFQLELLQHDPSKFDAIDYGTVLDDRPISVLPPGVQEAPAQVLITSHQAVDQGISVTTMTIGWDSAPGAVAYDVEWKWGSRDWIKLPRTGELTADVRGVYSGEYLARVRAVNAMGVSSIPTSSMLINVAGKTSAPPAVTHLAAKPIVFGIELDWGFPEGAEDTQRTEVWYGPTSDRAAATKLTDLAYPQSDYKMQGLLAGVEFFFWARLVDRTGNIGPFYPDGAGVVGRSSSDPAPILELLTGKYVESEVGQQLSEKIDDLQAQIEALDGLSAYKPDQTYFAPEMTLANGRIYQATQAVPVNTPPPNVNYWIDVGSVVEAANGLAQQVQQNTADIDELGAEASSVQVLRAAWRDDNGEGDLQSALKQWDTQAAYANEIVVRATQDQALATATETLRASVAGNTAAVQQVTQAQVTTDGKISTLWTLRMEATSNGQPYAAGFGLGLASGPGGATSTFVVRADTFLVMNTNAQNPEALFGISGGQTFLKSAFIEDGSITSLKVGNLQSNDYVANTSGWLLPKTGPWQLNGSMADGRRSTIENSGFKLYHANGVLGVALVL
ncbi:DUF1983 domain-containing protein [Pseudomonas cichorii]|nr:phage tail protein [Pseudomonas cichorii]MBX8474161.1 DUF1983 domain-containing protein [Pseudomonas cichorii]GFM48954.1 hypothetical protein PSCICE_02210 [Pseudomonas cichorii]